MPTFAIGDDPGSSFPELLRRVGLHPSVSISASGVQPNAMGGLMRELSVPHATTCVALRYDNGVVMAGDRRATAGNLISHRTMEKVEGATLSLEGKANQLSTMVRTNLPAAMQGMVVVPIFAGYDMRRGTGRLWDFDATGGRYEERDYVA